MIVFLLLLLALPAHAEQSGLEPRDCYSYSLGLYLDDGISRAEELRRLKMSSRTQGLEGASVSADMTKESISDPFPKITVTRAKEGTKSNVHYLRTNRSFEAVFPGHDPKEFAGKKVLDIGCGGGALVTDLRVAGVDAYGIDVVLDPASRGSSFLFQRDALHTGFEDSSVDVVISNLSIFSYEKKNVELMKGAISEVHRILKKRSFFKKGGIVYLKGGYPEEVILGMPEFRVLEKTEAGITLEKVR